MKAIELDYRKIGEEIGNIGYALAKGVLTLEETETYRLDCEKQFDNAPRLEGKNYVENETPNYVQPWMINEEEHEVASTRLYEFYHNPMSPNTKSVVDRIINIRDRIERKWPGIQELNEKENFHDYNIVAKYAEGAGYQSIHYDSDPNVAHPTLQCQIMLTHYGDDFTGGELLFHMASGEIVNVQKDMKPEVGDLIMFDKRLAHEVKSVGKGEGANRGRWMALIGAKTFPRNDSNFLDDTKIKAKRFLFLHFNGLHTLLKRLIKR